MHIEKYLFYCRSKLMTKNSINCTITEKMNMYQHVCRVTKTNAEKWIWSEKCGTDTILFRIKNQNITLGYFLKKMDVEWIKFEFYPCLCFVLPFWAKWQNKTWRKKWQNKPKKWQNKPNGNAVYSMKIKREALYFSSY